MNNTLAYLHGKYSLDLTESKVEIPNVSRLDLLRWFRELDFKVGAEIGVAAGEYSKLMCEINPQALIYGVDPWKPYRGYRDYTSKSTFSTLKEEAVRRMTPYVKRERYEIVEEFSEDALKRFEDNSLDFVYIDANHQAPFVDFDIENWAKKVRPGGIVAGHDYVRIRRVVWGVVQAIDRYTKDNGIQLFILGTNAEQPGRVREGSRSWMFIKP